MFKKVTQRVKDTMLNLCRSFRSNLPIIILGILMCFCVNAILGESMVVVAVVSVITIRELYKTTFNFANYLRHLIIFLILILLGTFASMNFIAGALINFAVLFVLCFIMGDNFIPGKCFTFGLELLLMEYQGLVSFDVLIARLICGICCTIFGGIVLIILNNILKKHKDNKFVLKGCKTLANKLDLLIGEKLEDDNDLFVITTDFCKEYYESMINQFYVMDEKSKYDFMSLMTMEQISDLIYETAAKLGNISGNDKAYFEELKRLMLRGKGLKRLAIDLDAFANEYELSNSQISSMWKKYILTLTKYIKYKAKPVIKSNLKDAITFRKLVLKKRFSITSYSIRSSLQTAIIVSVCGIIGQLLPVSELMLLPLTSFLVLSVLNNKKISSAFVCCIEMSIIIVMFYVLLTFVPFSSRFMVSVIICVIGMIISKNLFVQLAFEVQIISVAMFPTSVVGAEVFMKVGFIAFSIFICWLLSKWIFNTVSYRKSKLQNIDLAQLNWTSIGLLQRSRFDDVMSNYLCEFMLIQHIMVDHLNSCSIDKNENNKVRYSGMLSFNCDLLTEIAYAMTILKPKMLPKGWITAMKKRLTNIF